MAEFPQYPHDMLPLPLQDGYGFTPVSPLLRTQMQSGRSKQRRRYRATPTELPLTWLMKADAQAQVFEAWYQDSLADGESWFYMNLKTPQGMLPYLCRFIDMYNGPVLVGGRYWQFTATLEIRERPVIQGGWGLYYPEALRYADIIDIALNREWPAA